MSPFLLSILLFLAVPPLPRLVFFCVCVFVFLFVCLFFVQQFLTKRWVKMRFVSVARNYQFFIIIIFWTESPRERAVVTDSV